MKNKQVQISLAIVGVIILAAIARLSDSIPNFAPIGALALFSGAVLKNKRWSFLLPIGAIFLSDVFFEMIRRGDGFYPGMVYNYLAYGLIVLIGFILRKRPTLTGIALAALAGSVTFFLVSNFGVWASGTVGYPYTAAGLVDCFVQAIPFAKGTFVSDLVFSGVFFSAYYLVTRRQVAIA